MKISAISDLHGNLPDVDFFIPGDVLCICGDVARLDIQRDLIKCVAWFGLKFVPWTDKLPFNKIFIIPGNHDFWLEEIGPKHYNNGKEITSMLLPGSIKGEHKIVFLCDNEFKYNHKTFYGTSWCPDLNNWAFYGDHDKLTQEYSKIPQNIDVLLTHCPPRFGNAGVVLQQGWNYLTNYGCQELAEEIAIKRPKWVFCGHVHSGDHRITTIGDSVNIVNVSMLDENYKKNYSPFNTEI